MTKRSYDIILCEYDLDGGQDGQQLLEDLRHQVQLIAEGHVGLNERLDRIESRGTLTFEQVKGWIDPYFRHVDSRIRIFEGWADRQNLTVVNAIRALLGKLPLEPPPTAV